jgi:hypothetical protein
MGTATRVIYRATLLYPGMFMPEESHAEIPDPSLDTVLDLFGEDHRWYAIEVDALYQIRFTSGDRVKWLTDEVERVARYLVGEVFDADGIRRLAEAEGRDYSILLANMEINKWPRMMRCRTGNFQPVQDGDTALTVAEAVR